MSTSLALRDVSVRFRSTSLVTPSGQRFEEAFLTAFDPTKCADGREAIEQLDQDARVDRNMANCARAAQCADAAGIRCQHGSGRQR